MARYIDLDKYDDYRLNCRIQNIYNGCDRDCVKCYYKNNGAEDVAPVIHAKWEELLNSSYFDPRMRCSNCGNIFTPSCNWICCPHCGAKMDKED